MKIFISWSGARSRAVAELFEDWIKCVLQASKPWISTHNIDSGELWFAAINEQLKETGTGIVCLTQDNKTKPWILFEAGALAKGLTTNRVCTFLIDLQPSDIDDPLAQFNHTLPNREGLWRLVQTLNNRLEGERVDIRTLTQVFDYFWPRFETEFRSALEQNLVNEPTQQRSEPEILKQILSGVRSLNTRVGRLEAKPSNVTNIARRKPEQGYYVIKGSNSRGGSLGMDELRAEVEAKLATGELLPETVENHLSIIGLTDVQISHFLQRNPDLPIGDDF